MRRRTEKTRPEVLTCWKDIARYMGKSVRTVQRWERDLDLPVRRPHSVNHKSCVIARPDDLDTWLQERWSRKTEQSDQPEAPAYGKTLGSILSDRIRTSHNLRMENGLLMHQISVVLGALVQNCNALMTQPFYSAPLDDRLVAMDIAETTSDRLIDKASL